MSRQDSSSTADRGTVVALVADLIFGARVRGTAESLGVPAVVVRRAEELVERARTLRPRLILVDLAARAGDPATAIGALKADPETVGIPVVAFVAHEDRAAIEAARQAGADRVMARSAFVRELPGLLRGAGGADRPPPGESAVHD
ncbi:MAG TPA: hypothetical protein VKZ58_08230 [Longimicrobiales bacterium]|nr:hypothetical protein [Longimicrobiales bacterium]